MRPLGGAGGVGRGGATGAKRDMHHFIFCCLLLVCCEPAAVSALGGPKKNLKPLEGVHRRLPVIEPIGGVYGFDVAEFPVPTIAAKEGDIVVQMHWNFLGNGDKPTVMRFVPGSPAVVTAHKNGELHWHNTIDSNPANYAMLLDLKQMVYSNRDHGITGFAFDPEFGVDGNNFAYMAIQAQPGYKKLPGLGAVVTSVPFYWGNAVVGGNWANDQCPQDAPPPNQRFCEHWGSLVRLTVDVATKKAQLDATLLMEQCGASETHGSGGIRFTSAGDMIIAYGDGSQYDNIDGTQDFGFPQYDACYNPTDPLPQGQFRSQRDEYVHGKIVQIFKASYQAKEVLVRGVDYVFLGKGFRNPFRHFVTADDTLYVADVGSAEALSERIFKTPLFANGEFNGGWPCVEGIPFDAPGNELARQTFLVQENQLPLCEGIYASLMGQPGTYLQPLYMYRGGFLDPEYPAMGARGSASITDIFVMPEYALINPKFKGKTFFSDLTKQGLWYFAQDGQQMAHVLLSGVTMVDSTVDPNTGIIYMLDHDHWRSVAIYSAEQVAVPVETLPPIPPPPPAPEAQRCHDPYNYPELEFVEDPVAGKKNTATLTIGPVQYNPLAPTETRGYNGMIPGPLMRMKACNTYHITLQNDMGGYQQLGGAVNGAHNSMRDPYITNLHTHGLHTSPVAPGDDPSLAIGPDEQYEYEIILPCDHSGGLHWYHPHHHGASTLQAGGGAQGLLVVEDNPWLEVPFIPQSVANAPEAFLHIQSMEVLKTMNAAAISGDTMYYTEISAEQNPVFYLINGCNVGEFVLQVESGGWTRVRTHMSSPEYNVIMELVPIGIAPVPTLDLVAMDGVYVQGAPRRLPNSKVFYSLSSRVDLLLYIPATQADVVYNIVVNWTGSAAKQVIGTVNAKAKPGTAPVAPSPVQQQWPICRPNYLADLRATPVGNVAPTRQIEVRANINGVLFPEDGTPLFEMGFDQVQQWIIGGTEAHPSHLHVAHMQLQNAAAQWADVPGFFKAGDWLDTVSLPGQATVRFRTERFGGDYFFHCHVYEHSDSGVMATVRVPYGPQGPHPSPAFQKYGTCPNVVRTVGTIPGTVQAEDFDIGVQGIAYNDLSATNLLAGGDRYDDAVDVQNCLACENGLAVGDIAAGEWLRYTLQVPEGGLYDMNFATQQYAGQTGTVNLAKGACFANAPSCIGDAFGAFTGLEVAVGVQAPAQARMSLQAPVEVDAGLICMQICFENGGFILDSISFEQAEIPTPAPTATTPAPTATTPAPTVAEELPVRTKAPTRAPSAPTATNAPATPAPSAEQKVEESTTSGSSGAEPTLFGADQSVIIAAGSVGFALVGITLSSFACIKLRGRQHQAKLSPS